MTIRPKTIRRLLLLASLCGASAAIVGTAFTARRHARETELAGQRDLGMKAFASGDLARAMPSLTSYVSARPDDVDAIYALACAHLAIETPGRDNLFDARSRLQQVLARQPNHLPAKRQLLTIYERTHLPRELLATADEVLAAAPGDETAARARAVALGELNREPEALTAWQAYLAIKPTDFRAQSQLLAMMKRVGRPAEELIAYARGNVERWPKDDRFQLPLATALREAGKDAEAQALLESIAARPQSDSAFVVELAAALDRSRAFDAAEKLLARSAKTLGSSSLSAALIGRMWQNGRHEQVIAATDSLASLSGKRDANALALRALSLAALGQIQKAKEIVADLEQIKGDDEATAWTTALRSEFADAKPSPQAQVRTLRDALSHDPDNGILVDWLGRAYRQSGEPEQAARCFREAAQRLPSWPTPCVELADTMLDSGRISDAVVAAKTAFGRAPSSPAVQLQVARVRYAELRAGTPSDADVNELLARIDALSRQLPREPALPAMKLTLLAARGDRAAADQAAATWLAAAPPHCDVEPLYEAAVHAGLDSSRQIFDRVATDGTMTPRLAALHAVALGAIKPSQGSAWMKEQTAQHADDPAWRLAEARVRTSLNDPAAPDLWKSLVNAFPTDALIQATALAEASDLIGDRSKQATVVERLKLTLGEDSSAYRIARTRWLSTSSDDNEIRQALTLAADLVRQQPNRAETRVLLARVLIRLDSATTAVDHFRTAHLSAPGDAGIAIEYADALRRVGRASESVAALKEQASRPIEDADARAALGAALFQAGAFTEAATLAQQAATRGAARIEERLLAASALEAAGNFSGAAELYSNIADDPHVSPDALAAAAAFERRQGREAPAAQLMERLARCDASADARARAAARYALEFGEIEQARREYAGRLDAADSNVEIALDAIDLEMSQRDLARASTLVNAAVARFPEEPRLNRARLELAALRARTDKSVDEAQAMDALADALNADPATRRQASAIRALREAERSGKVTPELATRLAALADADPSSIELAREAIAAAFATNQPQLAGDLARRLLATAGARMDAVALAAQALAELHDFPAARRAAERWRMMSGAKTTEADIALARIALAEESPARALNVLEPHRGEIAWSDPALPITFAEALGAAGRADEAFALLDAGLVDSQEARAAWLRLAVKSADVDAAMARIEHLEAVTPSESTDERVRLAGACLERAQAAPSSRAVQQGMAILTPLEAAGRLTASARALLAELQRTSGNFAAAESTLREALSAEPRNAMVKNSLAYLLLSQPGHETEACRLATEAVDAAPKQAAFRDTLARAFFATSEPEKAEAAFREAIKLDDRLLDAWVGLARLQAERGKTADAAATIRKVEAVLQKAQLPEPPPHLREELRSVRFAIATTHE